MNKLTLSEMKLAVENAPEGAYWYSPETLDYPSAYLSKDISIGVLKNGNPYYYATKAWKGCQYIQLSKLKRLIAQEENAL